MKQLQYDKNLSYGIIKYKYNTGVFDVEDILQYVEMGNITKDDFKDITRYNYDGYREVHRFDKK